jgi:hypothetical protein
MIITTTKPTNSSATKNTKPARQCNYLIQHVESRKEVRYCWFAFFLNERRRRRRVTTLKVKVEDGPGEGTEEEVRAGWFIWWRQVIVRWIQLVVHSGAFGTGAGRP